MHVKILVEKRTIHKTSASRPQGLKRSRGVALITAMLVTSIATLAAVALASRQSIDIRRTGNVLESEQAYLYVLGIETVAKELLLQYTKQGQHYDDPELLFVPYTFPVDNGVVNGNLLDMEARYNINNLLDDKGEPINTEKLRLERLITLVAAKLDESVDPQGLVNAVVDWLDENEETTFPGGAEDSEYSSAETPRRAANRRIASTSELFMVEGFTAELLRGKTVDDEVVPGLLNYVSALPGNATTINVNTAETEVLQALSSYITDANIETVIAGRPFEDVSKFKDQDTFKDLVAKETDPQKKTQLQNQLNADLAGLDVESSYFVVNATAQVGRSASLLNSLIYRDTAGRSEVLTISRAQGTDGI